MVERSMNLNSIEKKWKQNRLNIILSIGIVICVGVTVWALFFRDTQTDGAPDYPPQKIEAGQIPLEDDNSDKIDSPEGGGAINVTFDKEATVRLSEEKITLYYANPNASNQNVAIVVMIENVIVAQSDLITPGNMITELMLTDDVISRLQEGRYDAILVVKAYEPNSGEKAMVDTECELTVTVKR